MIFVLVIPFQCVTILALWVVSISCFRLRNYKVKGVSSAMSFKVLSIKNSLHFIAIERIIFFMGGITSNLPSMQVFQKGSPHYKKMYF